MRHYKTIDFSRYASIKIGPTLEVWVIEDEHYPQDAYIIGGANNVLLSPTPPPLMVLSKAYDYIKIENGRLVIGAATPGGKVVSFCKRHNIANFEFMAHLPGTVGGMIKMNAGLKEWEIFNYLYALKLDGDYYLKEHIPYGYRYCHLEGVVFEAHFNIEEGFQTQRLEMFRSMRSNQPKASSAGSCFKNPTGDHAGRLIEAVGLKGWRHGAVGFSAVHANFLVNYGGGTFDDAMYVISLAQQRVAETFGIVLDKEIIVLHENCQSKRDI